MQLRLLSGFLVWSLGAWLAAFQQVLLFAPARTCQLHMCAGNGALAHLLANTAHLFLQGPMYCLMMPHACPDAHM